MLSSNRGTITRALAFAMLMLPGVASAQMRAVAGTYTTTVNGPAGALKAVIVLKKTGTTYSGTLAADGYPEIPVSNVVASDTGVTLVGDAPDGGVNVSMKFVGADKVTGKLAYQGAEMALEGTFMAASGAAPAPAMASGAAATNVVGTYELKSTEPVMGNNDFPVTCVVSRAAGGAYEGTCGNDQGTATISTVTVAGSVVTLQGDSPAGPFKIVITLAGRDATGTMTLGADTAKMKGTFAAK